MNRKKVTSIQLFKNLKLNIQNNQVRQVDLCIRCTHRNYVVWIRMYILLQIPNICINQVCRYVCRVNPPFPSTGTTKYCTYVSVYDMRSVGCRNRRQACAFFFTNCLDLWGSVKVGFPVSGKGVRTVHTDIIHI